jgi:hypothetical protein
MCPQNVTLSLELQGSAQAEQVNKIKMGKGKQTVQFSSSNNKQCYR